MEWLFETRTRLDRKTGISKVPQTVTMRLATTTNHSSVLVTVANHQNSLTPTLTLTLTLTPTPTPTPSSNLAMRASSHVLKGPGFDGDKSSANDEI
ncbi:hypothetical protein CROQUDRAFT_109090 [Cronartium quercuum f. sp. fusiforme G11]|uniref:Uncharacterized protein n=1 Tax=Cronartium quercuum f. sp. fusiforme G11 TaxID=708437 RepID=A0A9P6NDI3_9BASI|nr:hypothetical protein CROQUDRAFT_109090 [Cronartium quercuum f. sp. fusiforme G11]